ncbi:MAG: peptidoglycan editing factor PgeF, partial [Archangium sp.]
MELLTASSLTVPHGFPTRAGGVSLAPFDSLNTSRVVGDQNEHVAENLRRLAEAAKVGADQLFSVSQVHGDAVVEAPGVTSRTEADALWTQTPGTAVGVRTADCVPILLEDPRSGRVAAVHAGWRGVIAEIVGRTLEVWLGQGTRPVDVRAAIGPCIQRCCFEVDGDLPSRFASAFGPEVVLPIAGKEKRHLDLPLAVGKTLRRLGVPDAHVVTLPQCTFCDSRFFSHRR